MRNVLDRGRPVPRWTRFAVAGLFAAVLAGCGGSDGATGATGPAGPAGQDVDPTVVNNLTAQIAALTQATNPETCVACHTGDTPVALSGSGHQAKYDVLYKFNKDDSAAVATNTGITVYDMAISVGTTTVADDTTTLTFKMAQNGAAFDCAKVADTYTIGAAYDSYAGGKFTFAGTAANGYYFSLKGTDTTSVGGVCTFKKVFAAADDLAVLQQIKSGHGAVVVYGADGITNPPNAGGKFLLAKYPISGALNLGGAAEAYTSAASSAACESCHTVPFLKHGYIPGTVNVSFPGTTTTAAADFYTCKSCHSDARAGGHQFWQILGDAKYAKDVADAAAAAKAANAAELAATAKTLGDRAAAIDGGAALTQAEKDKYGYKTRLMNDVHMSHAMEFPYPQAMNSCVTCHNTPAKLDTIFSNANFVAETCVSCHSVDGIKAKMATVTKVHDTYLADFDNAAKRATMNDCSTCHDTTKTTPIGPTARTFHSGGYNPKIYATDGTRYSNTIKADIGAVTFDSATNKLNIKVTATGKVGTVDSAKIVPTFLVGLYGYDSKDFLVAAHGTHPLGGRNLEAAWGTTNARFTWAGTAPVTANGVTTWEATVDLSTWADKIAAGAIKRAEIAAMPTLKNAAGTTLALNAPSKTFNLKTNAVVAGSAIIPTGATTCNSCHDALATTFHSGDRGGNIAVCRICHEVSSPGSHLELQSRSIDSYVHAIHSFQAFDMETIDLTDAFTKMEYKHHTTTSYPKFGITDCESCHAPGTYDVPSQKNSMPGVNSPSEVLKGGTRNVVGLPGVITGPGVRACGSCHLSQAITADDSTKVAILTSHLKQNGYRVETNDPITGVPLSSTDRTTLWNSIVAKLMAVFK